MVPLNGSDLPESLRDRASRVAPVRSALVAYSGGMDSVLCVALMPSVYRCHDVRVAIGDIGQGEAVIAEALRRLSPLPVASVERIDLRADFLGDWLPRAIRANASLRGYPIAAPMVKQLLGRRLGEIATAAGCDAVVEGSSGLGNDQFRFASALARFAPGVRQVSPVRELFLSRAEEVALCDAWSLEYDQRLPMGGDDVTPWCRSIASGAFGLHADIDPAVLMWVDPSSTTATQVTLSFQAGVPVALDGRPMDLGALLDELNPRLGAAGLGLIDVIEDSRLEVKGREIYEAPAATAILAAKRELETLCLTVAELDAKVDWEARWLRLVYNGEAYHPLIGALDAAVTEVQSRVCGEVVLSVRAGALRVVDRRSSRALLDTSPRLAEARDQFQSWAGGALSLQRQRYLRMAGRRDE